MSDGEVWGIQQSLTMKFPLVTWRQHKYFFFFFLYLAWLQSESLAHIFKAKEFKSKPETKSEADKAPILQIKLVLKDIETTFCNLHVVIKHNRPIYESYIMLASGQEIDDVSKKECYDVKLIFCLACFHSVWQIS